MTIVSVFAHSNINLNCYLSACIIVQLWAWSRRYSNAFRYIIGYIHFPHLNKTLLCSAKYTHLEWVFDFFLIMVRKCAGTSGNSERSIRNQKKLYYRFDFESLMLVGAPVLVYNFPKIMLAFCVMWMSAYLFEKIIRSFGSSHLKEHTITKIKALPSTLRKRFTIYPKKTWAFFMCFCSFLLFVS